LYFGIDSLVRNSIRVNFNDVIFISYLTGSIQMKRYAKHLVVTALAAGISLAGTVANAGTPLTFIGGTANFGNTFSTATGFNDLFTFTTGSGSTAGAYVVSSLTSFPFPVTFTSFNLINENTHGIVAGGTGTIGPSFFAYLGPAGLAANTPYGLNVIGTSLAGGSYKGSITQAVPEPSTWAMMLGGLGLIGFMSYRRRQYF
jgi:hypothetical protein